MAEYIKREDAIKAITRKHDEVLSVAEAIEDIESVPSADVVEQKTECACVPSVWTDDEPPTYVLQKHGKWELVSITKLYESGLYVDDEIEEKCSLCGCHTFRYETQKENNFCPNCGADMREGEDGEIS